VKGIERFIVLWALLYMAVYIPFFFAALHLIPGQRVFTFILPFHFLGMAQNLVAFIVTIRDLYKRTFPRENQKLTWLLLIVCTGGIGWIVYIFKHGLKPRDPANAP